MRAALQGSSGQIILGPASLTIGRTPDNQLIISDAQASSYHAVVSLSPQGYSITDLGSTNGTFVNEQRLEPSVPRILSVGERIRIGDTIFTYDENAQAAPDLSPMGAPYPYDPYRHTGYGPQNQPPYSPYPPLTPSQQQVFSQPR